jgi:integrase
MDRRRRQGRQASAATAERRSAQGAAGDPAGAPDDAVGAVFRGKRGPYTARGIEYLLAEVGRRAQVPNVHPHRFRHDAARRLVESIDLPTVAAWLGHERLETVRIYSQPDEAALELERHVSALLATGSSYPGSA